MSERNKNNAEHIIADAAKSMNRRTLRGGVWPVWKDSRRDPVKFEPIPKREAVKRYWEAEALERSAHQKGKHGGRLGRAALRVLHCLTFEFLNFQTGQLDPGYGAIAEKTGLAFSTIWRALGKLISAGVLHKDRRAPWNDAQGRLVQDTNAYSILAPARWIGWRPRTAIVKPEPGTWGDHPAQQRDPLTDAVDAIKEGARGVAQRLLEGGEKESLADRLARLGRARTATGGASS
jgi:hypothetical protein